MKKLLLALLVLTGSAFAQYNVNIGGLSFSSGPSVPGACAPNGRFFFKSSTTQDWYKCIAGSYVAMGSVSGTVTSVGLSTDQTWLTIASSPVTGAGTMTLNGTAGQAANRVVATPDGTTGTVSLRALVAGDIPALAASKITSGTFTLAGALFANQGTTAQVLHGNAAGNPAWGSVVNGDIAASTIDLSAKVDSHALPRANGGLNSTSAGTGIIRDGTTPAASELSGDATTSGSNAVTVVKVNGVAYAASPSTDTVPIITASNTATYSALNNCTGGASALSYATSTHAVGCLTAILTGSLTSTRVPFASGANALTDSANLVYAAATGFTQVQGANAADAFLMKRATDTVPTGNFLRFRNAAASSDLFLVDVSGNVTATSYSATNASGNAGMLSLVQGTAPSAVSNAVNIQAPTSVTTYTLTLPAAVAAGFWNQTSGGVISYGPLSGDVTSSALATTVAKVNGVAYGTNPSTDTVPVITAANTATYSAVPDCNTDASHAIQYDTATHAWSCGAITGSAAAGGSDGQVQYNNSTAIAGGAFFTTNKTDTVTIGVAGSVLGKLALAGNTSGSTTLVGAAAGGGTWTLRNATDSVVGIATADALTGKTYNGLTVTTTSGTFTLTNSKTFSVSNTMTLAGTDSSTYTFPGASATIPRTVASGTSALGTGAISSGACATVVTTSATGVATTDVVLGSFNGDPTGVTGYAASANGMLTIIGYPTADNVNWKVCNNTASSITPGAITLNWRVTR